LYFYKVLTTQNILFLFQWNGHRAHVRWTYSFDEPIDSQSVPSPSPKTINLPTADSPPVQHPSTLRRLLLQQFLGDHGDLNDDDDDDNEESQSQ
jgi:hypothetical protein